MMKEFQKDLYQAKIGEKQNAHRQATGCNRNIVARFLFGYIVALVCTNFTFWHSGVILGYFYSIFLLYFLLIGRRARKEELKIIASSLDFDCSVNINII